MPQVEIPPGDLDRLLRNAGAAILVGGQALAFWIAFYSTPMDDAPAAVITKDADFLGEKGDAQRFSVVVNGTVEYPRNMSILAGIVKKKLAPDQEYEVDVLRTLNGLSPAAIRKHAKEVSDSSRNARYLVMSPIDCLIGRFENLRMIVDKQTEMGAWQARIAVRVARSHLEHLLQDGKEREAIRGATEILRVATHPMGLNAFKRYGIDVLDAVPIRTYQAKNFIEQQWTRSKSRVQKLRSLADKP